MARLPRNGFVGFAIALAGCASALSTNVQSDAPPVQPVATRIENPTPAAPLPAVEQTPLEKPFPVPIVVLRGSSVDLGREQGVLLTHSIRLLHDQYLTPYLSSQMKRVFALSAARLFAAEAEEAHLTEINALADAAGLSRDETMLGQCFLDLSAMSGCSTVTLPASASPDGVPRFGRNLDFPSLDVADKYTVVFVVEPTDGRYAFASVGWPGMVGVLSGMNEYGLAVANMELPREPRWPSAMPYTLLYRAVLERCRTVDEAAALLKRTPIQSANNLMMQDATGARAVAELTPAGVTIRRGLPGEALLSTNHIRGQDQDTPGACWRYDKLHAESKADFGKLDESAVAKMLAGVGSVHTLQAMIFEPTTRTLWLSAGTGAAERPMTRLELAPFFAAGGDVSNR